ncbi:MAG TPA: radical SAM protein [Allosphingosinicella sp.]|nr:radical SAM protein [Allosphingosinicella sp.]
MDMPAAPRSPFELADARALDPAKFRDPDRTAKGERRARVAMERLDTLWINTGTLCNLACRTCYIESSPTNDALAYLSLAEAEEYFDQARTLGTRAIGFTGGEPFMNPDMIAMMRSALARGFELLVLTNAMRPMRRFEPALAAIAAEHAGRVVVRVSLDHYSEGLHEAERGRGTWAKALDGLAWLARAGFRVAVAGRRLGGEAEARAGYGQLFRRLGVEVDHLVLFPTMDGSADAPEISEGCWDVLHVDPAAMMCASSRMVVKAKGAARPHVVACTLLPHDERFAMGETLAEAMRPVSLNHPHCARFCALGGASCSG